MNISATSDDFPTSVSCFAFSPFKWIWIVSVNEGTVSHLRFTISMIFYVGQYHVISERLPYKREEARKEEERKSMLTTSSY